MLIFAIKTFKDVLFAVSYTAFFITVFKLKIKWGCDLINEEIENFSGDVN